MKSQSLRFPITSFFLSLIVIASTHSKTSMANLSTTTSEQSGFSESALSLKPRLSEKQSELMALLDEKNEDK